MRRLGRVAVGAALLGAVAAHAAGDLIVETTGDFNRDGIADRALLVEANDQGDVDLQIFLSRGGKLPTTPTLVKSGFGWTGAMAGQTPSIGIGASGALTVSFGNGSIGRDRWEKDYTIAWRQGRLVVAGYSETQRDTLDPNAGGSCDIDLLTGKGRRNDKPVAMPPRAVPLADWSDKDVPAACRFE